MARFLLIVARDQPEVHNYLARKFVGDQEFHVFLDRRQEERRQRIFAHGSERRAADRRRDPDDFLRWAPTGKSPIAIIRHSQA
ncbi:MAG: hypothetical protein ACE5JN_13020 [Candidatus Methylomirabilia bacterium]